MSTPFRAKVLGLRVYLSGRVTGATTCVTVPSTYFLRRAFSHGRWTKPSLWFIAKNMSWKSSSESFSKMVLQHSGWSRRSNQTMAQKILAEKQCMLTMASFACTGDNGNWLDQKNANLKHLQYSSILWLFEWINCVICLPICGIANFVSNVIVQ